MAPDEPGHVAVVDDERNLRETVGFALREAGYAVSTYADGAAAWEGFETGLPDVAVLDILMPRLDGLELCRRLRRRSERLPILFLTSRDEEFDRVLGLELGADDYLCKPFSMRELVARVRVLFRRLALADGTAADAGETLRVGALALDTGRMTAAWDGRALPLTVTEFTILFTLAERPGHVRTRRQLIDRAWSHDSFIAERTVDTHIKRLRKKLAAAAGGADDIETVHGLGYRYREP